VSALHSTAPTDSRASADEDAPALQVIRHDPYNAETPEPVLAHSITPTQHAYVRTNFDMPELSATHVIEIGGAIERPLSVSLATLRDMTQHTVTTTMECAGNDRLGMHPLPTGEPWDHGALSTLTWTGVPLADVLDLAGVRADAVEVLVTAADAGPRDDAEGTVRFARSLPMADARRRDTVLALAMNGAPLTREHGAPVRLAVPGWYGMASVKWVTRIDVLTTRYTGYFQRQRYVYDEPGRVSPVDRMRVKSIIASPANGERCTRHVVVTGWAWSGFGAITRVELGVDGGEQWMPATLGEPVSEYAWTPWHAEFIAPRAGRFVLRSRATDASGTTQPDAIVWNRLGYGNNAIRHIMIDVE
jgi:DMSO/TMAO reductase YedYZ molybdopterin-dependent catalytic subunit